MKAPCYDCICGLRDEQCSGISGGGGGGKGMQLSYQLACRAGSERIGVYLICRPVGSIEYIVFVSIVVTLYLFFQLGLVVRHGPLPLL